MAGWLAVGLGVWAMGDELSAQSPETWVPGSSQRLRQVGCAEGAARLALG